MRIMLLILFLTIPRLSLAEIHWDKIHWGEVHMPNEGSSQIHGLVSSDPGMMFGGVCLGPRGEEEACPGELISCETVMVAINDELSLFHAKITAHSATGDQVDEFIAPMGGGINFTDPDSASFSFVTTVSEADRGTNVFVRVEGEAQVLQPFNGCCATGSWGVFYNVPTTCPVAIAETRAVLNRLCRVHKFNKHTGKIRYAGCKG